MPMEKSAGTRAPRPNQTPPNSIVGDSEDFDPPCVWERDEACDTLIFHLSDFKKEQLRVQINNQVVVKVSGDRPSTGTRRRRFVKEVKVPKDCVAEGVRAKFSGGRLHIIMPKKASPAAALSDTSQRASSEQAISDQNEAAKERDANNGSGGGGGAALGLRSLVPKFKIDRKTAINVVAVVATAAGMALGAFFTYKYWHSRSQVEN